MRNFISCKKEDIPDVLSDEITYISQYKGLDKAGVDFFAPKLMDSIQKIGVEIPDLKWDFLTIALSINTIDNIYNRNYSPDGWTREIGLKIAVLKPDVWNSLKNKFESVLRLLTGDFWHIDFINNGMPPPLPRRHKEYSEDCLCTLSGGMDSLIGAIDLISAGKRPILVSRVANANVQSLFARTIGPNLCHFQWGFYNSKGEITTRARSIVFIAFSIILSAAVQPILNAPIDIYLPENGFISINPPLYYGRIGSYSTKTTHPIYINGLQEILSTAGINVAIHLPYRFFTKGEMLSRCLNQKVLSQLLPASVSCGKYGRNHQHCGKCIPCIIRKSALFVANMQDRTARGYINTDLLVALKNLENANDQPSDIGAISKACYNYRNNGIDSVLRSSVAFASLDERELYKGVIDRGFEEISLFLESIGFDFS